MHKIKLYTKPLSLTVWATIITMGLLCIPGCSPLEVSLDNVIDDGHEPVQGHIMTQWAKKVSPGNAHKEYPRPQNRRGQTAEVLLVEGRDQQRALGGNARYSFEALLAQASRSIRHSVTLRSR